MNGFCSSTSRPLTPSTLLFFLRLCKNKNEWDDARCKKPQTNKHAWSDENIREKLGWKRKTFLRWWHRMKIYRDWIASPSYTRTRKWRRERLMKWRHIYAELQMWCFAWSNQIVSNVKNDSNREFQKISHKLCVSSNTPDFSPYRVWKA